MYRPCEPLVRIFWKYCGLTWISSTLAQGTEAKLQANYIKTKLQSTYTFVQEDAPKELLRMGVDVKMMYETGVYVGKHRNYFIVPPRQVAFENTRVAFTGFTPTHIFTVAPCLGCRVEEGLPLGDKHAYVL